MAYFRGLCTKCRFFLSPYNRNAKTAMEIELHAKKALFKGVYLLSPWSNPPNSRWGAAGVDREENGERVSFSPAD